MDNKFFLFFFLGLFLFPCVSLATVIDAPHNATHDMSCGSCHSYSLWWQFSPSDQLSDRNSFIVEPLCDSCHNGLGSAPFALSHSASAMGGMHQQRYGDWGRSCLDCHDPHFQQQFRQWVGGPAVLDTDIFLAQGSIDIGTLVDNGNNTSSFAYSLVSEKTRTSWADPNKWSDKSGPGRGVILVVSLFGVENTFEVFSATETTSGYGVMTVNGAIPASFNGADFGLIYGQLIKKRINGAAGPVDVKFFDGHGGFVRADLDGICQVCHTQTDHFQYNFAIDGHINVLGAANAATLRCTTCHAHDVAFGHGTDGGSDCLGCHNTGKHVSHLSLELTCIRCHDITKMRDDLGQVVLKYNSSNLAGTTVCAECHHDGTDLIAGDGNKPPNQTDFKNGWDSTYTFSCSGCHSKPPAYVNGVPKANSHPVHDSNGYGCENCHYGTTVDGSTLMLDGSHVNNVYDLVAGPGVNLDYVYDVNGGTCSNISCHNGQSAVWGSSLTCIDCHQNAVDVNGFESQETARINISEWQTTGHGRDWDSNSTTTYNGSGNPGAGLICAYCHKPSVGHNTALNPYRLANVEGSDGMNGVCWACHKTGSSGYDPDGVETAFLLKNAMETKVDSSHSGSRHGTGVNNGGKFCWDCHDPHGDSNIYMIHDDVTLMADQTYGRPLASAAVSFVATTTGTDYAQSSGSFNGICNVCHTNTGHYTTSSGDGHQAGQRCTNCHKHSGVNENDAFSQGSCLLCHNTVRDDGNAIPATGRRAMISEFPVNNSHAHYGNDLDSGDCTVCHDQSTHMDGYVDLLDADTGAGYRFIHKDDLVSDPDISDFCLSCHDSDGAKRLATPFDPFGSGNVQPVQPDVASKFSGSIEYSELYYGADGYGGSERPVNSHHDISDSDQQYSSNAKVECLSCHGVHNVSADYKIVDPFDTSNVWGDNMTAQPNETINNFCLSCHSGGNGPVDPGYPAHVKGPLLNYPTKPLPSPPPPDKTPNTFCGVDLVWDCGGRCVSLVTALKYVGDLYCDDTTYGMDLRCPEFQNDKDDCQCYGQDCTWLGGIDSCEYVSVPWNIDFSWSNASHGFDSKRSWPQYSLDPVAPSYVLDCTDCHDPHGSSWQDANGTIIGNPYMIKDYVDGTEYVDDGCRHDAQAQNCVPGETMGTAGEVQIQINGFNPDFGQLCVRCHADWVNASISHNTEVRNNLGDDCLRCHAHGGLFGGKDWGTNGTLETGCVIP